MTSQWTNKVEFGVKTDILWNASAQIGKRIFEGKAINERTWLINTTLILIGFVAYHILIASWLDTSNQEESISLAINDALKFSMMFGISRLLSGQSMSDPEWYKASGLFVASIVAYDIVLYKIVKERTENLDTRVKIAVTDVIKFGSIFTLQHALLGNDFNEEWAMSSGGFLVGVVVYDMFLAPLLEGKF